MVERYELFGPSQERLGNPAPLGLLGVVIACAALVPIAFGAHVGPTALTTVAVYALLFGAGCQLLAGLMMFVNKNGFGGTVFTCFSFLWATNAWSFQSIADGKVPDHTIGLAVEVSLFLIFAGLTWGFGHFARALFLFLVDIDLLFVFRIVKSATGTTAMTYPIAFATVGLGAIALWLALGSLLNPLVGRSVFPVGPPVFRSAQSGAASFDWSTRRAIFTALYDEWKRHAFRPVSRGELEARVASSLGREPVDLSPDLHYLAELGYAVIDVAPAALQDILTVRLHARGVDIHEQLVLGKYAPAAAQH